MKLIVGFLTLIGLAVVLVFLAAIGLFAFDEVKRKIAEDEFAPVMPPATPEAEESANEGETS
jgi:cbb3-type cytochrome oxidase subunit 3